MNDAQKKNRPPLSRIKNPFVVVLIATVTTLALVLVFAAAVTSGDKITRYLRTGWPPSSPSPTSCYGGACPSPSPTSGSCIINTSPMPEHKTALQGPGEFSLLIDWDRIGDAQRFGDNRKISANLVWPQQPESRRVYYLTEQRLSNQCMQPDADTVVEVPRPKTDYSGVVSDATQMKLLVKVDGAAPDGARLKITGWDNCTNVQNLTRDGGGNVTASQCVGNFGQWKGKTVTVKVRSTKRNYAEILGPPPSCGSYPNDYPCPAPTCYQGSCQMEILDTYTAEDGLKVVEAYALPSSGIPIEGLRWFYIFEEGSSDFTFMQAVLNTQLQLRLWDGRVFIGTARQVAAELSASLRRNVTVNELLATIGAAKDAAKSGGAVIVGGAGAGTATAVSAGTAACWAAGGAVLVAEVAFMGWEVYDIGSSANSYCNAGGDLSGFFKTTLCDLYPIYWAGKPAQWCWPDWIPF